MSNFKIIEEEVKTDNNEAKTKIMVIGIGGAGCNAIDNMIESELQGVEFVAINTDAQALFQSKAKIKLQIGEKLTKGLGAGGSPEKGKNSAIESEGLIRNLIKDSNMVFLTAGFGKGTGTGASPVIAKICKENDILTIAVIAKPFSFEREIAEKKADAGLKELAEFADNVIVIQNDKIIPTAESNLSFRELLKKADEVLKQSIQGISSLITLTGYVNLDFNDIKRVMSIAGDSIIGIGVSEGEGGAVKASEEAISNYLLEDIKIENAKAVLINIRSSVSIPYKEFIDALNFISSKVSEDTEIIWGTSIDENSSTKITVTVIVTGITTEKPKKKAYNPSFKSSIPPISNPIKQEIVAEEEPIYTIDEIKKNRQKQIKKTPSFLSPENPLF